MKTNQDFYEALSSQIDNSDVISFDIFDTLIIRKLFKPDDVFYLLALEAAKIGIMLYPNTFRTQRIKAERIARSKSHGEVTIYNIYEELKYLLGISESDIKKLIKLEIEIEFEISERRQSMGNVFDYALSKNKHIIFTSDMYLPKESILMILKKNGYNIPQERIFISNEFNATKSSGKLYDIIKKYALDNLNTDNIIHIGDNESIDLKKARECGLKAFMCKKISEFYLNVPYVKKMFTKWLDFSFRDISFSLYCSLIAKKFLDMLYIKSPLQGSHFSASSYCLGYSALGFPLVGFCDWLYKQSKKDNIDTLLFVARDGYIVKCVYDIVSKYYIDAPKSLYLYASRRSFSVPTYCTANNFSEIFLANPFKGTLKKFITSRLGLDLSAEIIHILHDQNIDIECDINIYDFVNNLELFSKIIHILHDHIKSNSQEEKNALLKYIESLDILNKNVALVDIGYSGTIAYCYNKITGNNAKSYNLIVNRGSVDIYQSRYGLDVKGYLLENTAFFNNNYSLYGFIEKFETLFSTLQQQIVKNKIENGKVVHVFLDEPQEKHIVRRDLVSSIHQGVCDFAHDFIETRKMRVDTFFIDPYKSVLLLNDHFQNPYQQDLNLWSDVYFENNFAGWDGRVIYSNKIPPTNINTTMNLDSQTIKKQNIKAIGLVGKIILKYQGEKKYFKYIRNKKRYFLESKNFISKNILSKIFN